ncbi:MAG: hypothetical protein RL701_4746 [Pseudomonadota bacterium]
MALALLTSDAVLPKSTRKPARVAVTLCGAAYEQLSRVANAHGASPRSTGLATLAVLLYRYTGASALSLLHAEPAANGGARPATRIELADDTTFTEVLSQIEPRARVRGVHSITRPRSLRQHKARIELRSDALRNLTLLVEDRGTELRLRLEYTPGPLPRLYHQELSSQLHQLLNHFAAAPDSTLLSPSLLSSAATQVLANPRAPLATPVFARVPDQLFAWSERTPNASAIRSGERSWTYTELAHSTRAIASVLAARVKPGDTVAITGACSFALVSALLAVWQCRAIILTLDPRLPRARRQLMIERANARLLLHTDTHERPDLTVSSTLLVTSDGVGLTQLASSESPNASSPHEDAAYVFFTSGSTGTPKAVLGSHQGLAHFLAWQRETFGILPSDRAAQLTGLSFDVVLRDIFLPLSSGACLCIPSAADVADGSRVLTWLAQERISIIHSVPSLATSWLEHVPDKPSPATLRCVFFAGEPLTDGFVERFRAALGCEYQLVNLYGPTETTLAKCYYVVAEKPEPNVQPVGSAIANTQLLILDRQHRQCGLHEPGEIAIRTPFRSLGYLADPEATARSFVPNPFGNDPNDLIYLTGDRGRYRHDGQIDILGRADGQLKIRGVRVELGEIEATLLRCPEVAAAAVIVREHADAHKSLCAYVVPHSSASALPARELAANLRAALQTQLPAALVPHHFISVSALPLTANGKLDRTQLLSLEHDAPRHAPPTTAREHELAAQWAAILQVPSVSVDASFYELGGDSLTAMRVMLRMRLFGCEETACQALLQGQTIAQIANPTAPQPTAAGTKLSAHERMRLLFQSLRAVLAVSMLSDHYLKRLGEEQPWASKANDYLGDFFMLTTPSFAIAFGLSLGFIYYPMYLTQRARTETLLRRNAMVVAAAFLYILFLSRQTHHFSEFSRLFLYYAVALATAGTWFRWLGRTRAASALPAALAILLAGANDFFHRRAWPPEVDDWQVFAVGKYGYFSLSVGALIGLAIGNELRRDLQVRRRWWLLAAVLLTAVSARSWLVGRGLFSPASYVTFGIRPWRWVMATGCVLAFLAVLDHALTRLREHSRAAVWMRRTSMLGQLTLPIFVLHCWSHSTAALITRWGAPPALKLLIDAGLLLGVTCSLLIATNRLFYGVRTR